MCKIVLLDFVRRQNYKIIKLQRFGSWILLPSSGKKRGEEDRKPIRWAPWLSEPQTIMPSTLSHYNHHLHWDETLIQHSLKIWQVAYVSLLKAHSNEFYENTFSQTGLDLMMLFFWVLAPCRLVGGRQSFGETYCLHLQPWKCRQYVSPKRWHVPMSLQGTKTPNIILTAVKTSNRTRFVRTQRQAISYLLVLL
jgi:hypothetical protein